MSELQELLKYEPLDYGHAEIREQYLVWKVMNDRYLLPEENLTMMADRVACAIFEDEEDAEAASLLIQRGLWLPGGRILAGAGVPSERKVTLFNCFVSSEIEDSMGGIYKVLEEGATVISKGGGIGFDFTPIRPKGSVCRGDLKAAGPVAFMHIFDAQCKAFATSGNRRGAQMAVMRIDHPDIFEFISSKHEKGALTQFNISVAVPDAFMKAVKEDGDWNLIHEAPPSVKGVLDRTIYDFPPTTVFEGGKTKYVYETVKAAELWDKITESTYEYSEPGVIFIDRVNDQNPLRYCETIMTTNPCGEQPLPHGGNCNLGAINLARMVREPFSTKAMINYDHLNTIAKLGTRFLDNVIDVSEYPTSYFATEGREKRRIGLGITGLADALEFLNIKYSSSHGRVTAGLMLETIYRGALEQSGELGEMYGPFPQYEKHLTSIELTGKEKDPLRRNGTLTTIAPTGTISLAFGNVSSGIEPIFAPVQKRVINEVGREMSEGELLSYAEIIRRKHKERAPKKLHNIVQNCTIADHLAMQSTCQQYVDSSISKTINLPESISIQEFRNVYEKAYKMGLKSCTTYRPSEVRGWILADANVDEDNENTKEEVSELEPDTNTNTEESNEMKTEKKVKKVKTERSPCLAGETHKIAWPDGAIYVTVNYDERYENVVEVFIMSKEEDSYMRALGVTITRLLSCGYPLKSIGEDLAGIKGADAGRWVSGSWTPSPVAAVGRILLDVVDKPALEEEMGIETAKAPSPEVVATKVAREMGMGEEDTKKMVETAKVAAKMAEEMGMQMGFGMGIGTGSSEQLCDTGGCQVVASEGCKNCLTCGYQKCE